MEREGRRECNAEVKAMDSTHALELKLNCWSAREGIGIPSVEVQCVDIRRNTSREGGWLDRN